MVVQRDQIILVDLEATCWKHDPPAGEQSEIIEIGLCVINTHTLELFDKRSILVKPTRSRVSDFCTKLTSLTPEQVESGLTFAEACDILKEEYYADQFLWGSWGGYDLRMFRAQCESFNVDYPFSDYHMDVKQVYADLRHKGKRCGLARAFRTESMTMEGTHHRGDDDAWNTGRMLAHMIRLHGPEILQEFWP